MALGVAGVQAKTFKWTSSSDIPAGDIHSQNNALSNGVQAAAYEFLEHYNSRTFQTKPVLANAWKLLTPNQEVAHIPLHNEVIPWAMKKNIDVVHPADFRLDSRLIKVN